MTRVQTSPSHFIAELLLTNPSQHLAGTLGQPDRLNFTATSMLLKTVIGYMYALIAR